MTAVAIVVIVVMVLFGCLVVADGILVLGSWFGNPVLRKLKLQGGGISESFTGRTATVALSDGSNLRVDLDGTSWNAEAITPQWTPVAGETVLIEGIEGLTLRVSKGDGA